MDFQVGMAKYNAIYSTFAAFPIFLFWIWASWVTVLLGAEFAYAHQNEPAYRQIARAREQGQAFKEILGVRIMARIAVAFLQDAPPLRHQSFLTRRRFRRISFVALRVSTTRRALSTTH